MGQRYFTPAVFTFLRELEANNNKEWWEDNKDRYVDLIREPALEFIADFGNQLSTLSPHFRADAKTVGGSLMRPYRDVRFSKDKTPYKTNVGIQFRHESGKDVHAPGYYLHLEPGENFAGVGLWSPETKVAHAIRRKINDEPDRWKEAAHSKSFTSSWSLGHAEEALKKVPKEYDADHPFADDIRRKSFTAGQRLSQKTVTSSDFMSQYLGELKKASQFNAFLCEAVGLPY
jgi:uncharacterized protein (TIGR02453 family)